jgi:hypothetical protein
MKRTLFYLIFAAALAGSTAVILFIPADGVKLWDRLDSALIQKIINGTFVFETYASCIFTYGIALFTLINAAILLTMLLIFLFSGFNLNKISKFYRITGWFLFSAILFSATYAWSLVSGSNSFNISDVPYIYYVPLAAAILSVIAAIVFRVTDKNRYY